MKRVLLISFDAVGDNEFDDLLNYPNFSRLVKQSAVTRKVDSIFISNTYPIHTSVVTGVHPYQHQLISNTKPFPQKDPFWISRESAIKVKTIWQAASQKGKKVAAVMWPVTAYSKSIQYNVPEVLARPNESQITTSLKAGSKLLQIKLFLRHRRLMNGIKQPELDAFSTACMVDILKEKKPDLALMHLTCYDSLCHTYGKDSQNHELLKAYESLDNNLGDLMKVAGEDMEIVLFSDHSQLNVHTISDPNQILLNAGLIDKKQEQWIMKESGCFFECCGGSVFFHAGTLAKEKIQEVSKLVSTYDGFLRFLTSEEMFLSGRGKLAFGFCGQVGYCFDLASKGEKANHGYPLDYDNYQVFYLVKGDGFIPGSRKEKGSLLDIAPIIAKQLELDLPQLRDIDSYNLEGSEGN